MTPGCSRSIARHAAGRLIANRKCGSTARRRSGGLHGLKLACGFESDHPPTVTRLASQGVAHRPKPASRHLSVQRDESEVSPSNKALTLPSRHDSPKSKAGPRSPWQDIECADARKACETLERFAECCEASSTEGIARAVTATEAKWIWRLIEIADKWLDSSPRICPRKPDGSRRSYRHEPLDRRRPGLDRRAGYPGRRWCARH